MLRLGSRDLKRQNPFDSVVSGPLICHNPEKWGSFRIIHGEILKPLRDTTSLIQGRQGYKFAIHIYGCVYIYI